MVVDPGTRPFDDDYKTFQRLHATILIGRALVRIELIRSRTDDPAKGHRDCETVAAFIFEARAVAIG